MSPTQLDVFDKTESQRSQHELEATFIVYVEKYGLSDWFNYSGTTSWRDDFVANDGID